MKTSSAVIKLFLRTSKVLSDGSSPIMLKCSFKGTKEVSTTCSCLPKQWDKKTESVKKSNKNYASINQIIHKMKQEAIERRNQFEMDGVIYTPAMVLKPKIVLATNGDLKTLADRYILGLSPTTQKTWKSFLNNLNNFRKIQSINEVDIECIKTYATYLEGQGLKESTIKMTLAKLAALCRYAVEEGLIRETPFKRWNYGKKYKTTAKLFYAHKDAIEVLKQMLLERLIIEKGDMYSYNDDGLKDFLDKGSDLFVLAFYLFGYIMQGLAPIDLAQLKTKDLRIIDINGVSYYAFDTKRQKTGFSVKIRINRNTFFSDLMIKTMLQFHKGEYLLPILDGVENDRLKIYKKVSNWLSNHREQLQNWFKAANERIVKMNVENNTSIPLIPVEATFYSYRDSFAMAYLSTPKASPVALATLMGRSANTLSSYISHLTSESDLADAVQTL